jgi:hypothetical protein
MKKMCAECPFNKSNYCGDSKEDIAIRNWLPQFIYWWDWWSQTYHDVPEEERDSFYQSGGTYPLHPIGCHMKMKDPDNHKFSESDEELQCVGHLNYIKDSKRTSLV